MLAQELVTVADKKLAVFRVHRLHETAVFQDTILAVALIILRNLAVQAAKLALVGVMDAYRQSAFVFLHRCVSECLALVPIRVHVAP